MNEIKQLKSKIEDLETTVEEKDNSIKTLTTKTIYQDT